MSEWHPIKYRPMMEEEKEHYELYEDDDEAEMFDCVMPEDGEKILITYEVDVCGKKKRYVSAETCEYDGYYYGLEDNDWDGAVAWMPFPEPFEGE